MTPHGPAGASPWSQSETESTGHSEELRTNEEDFRLRSTSAEKAAGNALGPYHGHIGRNASLGTVVSLPGVQQALARQCQDASLSTQTDQQWH